MYTYAMIALPAYSMVSLLRAGINPYMASQGAAFMFLIVTMFGGIFTKLMKLVMANMHEIDAYYLYRLIYLYWY